MTNIELKKKIAAGKNVEWHINVQETFNFININFSQTITSVSAVYEFVNQQIKGWEKYEQPLPNELVLSKTYFENIKNLIIQFVTNYTDNEDGNLQHYWTVVKRQIENTSNNPIPYNCSQSEFLISVYNDTPLYFHGAFNFLVANNYSINTKELFFGAIIAYEFSLKDKTEIHSRKKTEQKSIVNLKNDFQNYLSISEQELVGHLKDANSEYENYVTQIDELKTEKENLFTEWFEKTKKDDWERWFEEKTSKLQKLEETYEAKLKLEKPAKYWQTKSTKYYQQGVDARTILLLVIGVTAVFLSLILVVSPDWIFKNVFNENSTAIIRWSIVFITLLTLIAFSVKAITKYMFSSFHLARDAEERHTLTFFYLSLLKDTEVKDDDRKLILQSLFSRVETGLLKDDSSPTMPSDLISKVIK